MLKSGASGAVGTKTCQEQDEMCPSALGHLGANTKKLGHQIMKTKKCPKI